MAEERKRLNSSIVSKEGVKAEMALPEAPEPISAPRRTTLSRYQAPPKRNEIASINQC